MKFDNNMRGVLFKNAKDGVATRADYRGSCEIERKEYWMDCWINTSRDQQKFLAIRFKPKLAAEVEGGVRNPPNPVLGNAAKDFDDDIPF